MNLITFTVLYMTLAVVSFNIMRILWRKDFKKAQLTLGGGGGGGKMDAPAAPPPPPPPPPAPTEDAEVVRQKAESERRRAAGAKGYSASDVTNGVFAGGNQQDVPKPTLLGGQ